MVKIIACIGAGTVGRGWAILFASGGYRVQLYDLSQKILDEALAAIDQSLADLQAAGRIDDANTVRERVNPTCDLDWALAGAVYVQENTPEDPGIKKAVFDDLDQRADPSTILASSTSEIPGSAFCGDLEGRNRCLVAHPLNPPYLIPLVELCPTPWTTKKTVNTARKILEGVGQAPILVRKEISGFIANRLQLAVLGEALHLVGEGYCNVSDIDITMKKGLARRWAFIGPLETGHLNASGGYRAYLDAYMECHRKIIADLNLSYEWSKALINGVHDALSEETPPEGIAERQAWRDRRLMALTRHLDDDERALG